MNSARWKYWLGGMSVLLVLLATAITGSHKAGDDRLSTASTLPELYISCNLDSLSLIQSRFKEDIYILASLRLGKQEWKGVRLRLRGDTSREFPKKSIKLKIPDGKSYPFGRNTLNLNAEFHDSTYLRQYLCTRIFKDSGQPCYDAQHVAVNINGDFHGIYLLVENMDNDFLKKRAMKTDGDLFKATHDGACLSAYDHVRLVWEHKTPKADTSWKALEHLIHLLNDTPDKDYYAMAKSTFDYQNMVNLIAVNMLIGNRSTYYHNYFIYRNPQKNVWQWLPWDMDNTFILKEVADEYQRGNNADTKMGNMPSNPYFERAIACPEILRDIRLRIDTLAATIYNPEHLYPMIDSLAAQLAPFITADTFYRKGTLATWQSTITSLKAYIRQRPAILLDQIAHTPTSFRLIRPEAPFHRQGTLRWRAASDPDGDALVYRLCYSREDQFKDATTRCFVEIRDTFYEFPEGFTPGEYYWKVIASDGKHETRGFDNYCSFQILPQ